MPSYRHHAFGDLYIQFDVRFPKSIGSNEGQITEADVTALEAILPPRMQPPSIPGDAMVEDFVLEDVDPSRTGTRNMTMEDDDDDDDMHPGAERVQCATQ